MNKLELLQQKTNGFNFIKSYPILRKLNISPISINILELVLSYEDNNQEFYMSRKEMANILSSTEGTIKKSISLLIKSNYVIVNTKSNYNGTNGGSKSSIKVNIDYIIQLLTEKSSNEVKQETNTNTPKVDKEPLKTNNIQPEIKEDTNEDIIKTITNIKGEIMNIDNDLIEFFNEKIKNKKGYIKRQLKTSSEEYMNTKLREKRKEVEQFEIDIRNLYNKNIPN